MVVVHFILAVSGGAIFLVVLGLSALHLTWSGVAVGCAAIGLLVGVAWFLT